MSSKLPAGAKHLQRGTSGGCPCLPEERFIQRLKRRISIQIPNLAKVGVSVSSAAEGVRGELAAVHGGGVAGDVRHNGLWKVVQVLAVGHSSSTCSPPCCHTQLVGFWSFGRHTDGGDLVIELKWFLEADESKIVGEEMLAPSGLRMGHNVLHGLDLGSVDGKVAPSRSAKENPADRVEAGAGEARMGGRQPFW